MSAGECSGNGGGGLVYWGRIDGGFRAAGPCGEVNGRPQRTAAVAV